MTDPSNNPVTLDMPGSLASHIEEAEMTPDGRAAYDSGTRINRGRYGYTLRITAPIDVHRYFLDRCWTLEGGAGVDNSAAERSAYATYKRRIESAANPTSEPRA